MEITWLYWKSDTINAMEQRDPISKQYFNQKNIQLVASAAAAEFGLDDVGLAARLTGAPDGSVITVSRGEYAEADTLNIQVVNPLFKYPSEYIVFNEGGSFKFMLSLDSMYVREEWQGQGIGVRSVILSINEAKQSGFSAVSLHAAGSARKRNLFFGYYVWPSIGFDAPLPTQLVRELPVELFQARYLSDLMKSGAGADWWYDNGIAMDLIFDLDDASTSWPLLNDYMKAKEISL